MAFVLLAVLQTTKQTLIIDVWATKHVSKLGDKTINFFKIFTYIGSIYTLISISISLLFFKNKKIGMVACLMLLFASLFNVIVKYIIRRPRPSVTHVEEVGYSFPSAHAMLTFVVLGFIIFLVLKYAKNIPLKVIISSMLALIIIAVGFSRVILGVHYFSDVLAGWVIAIPILIVAISLFNYIDKHKLKINKRLM